MGGFFFGIPSRWTFSLVHSREKRAPGFLGNPNQFFLFWDDLSDMLSWCVDERSGSNGTKLRHFVPS